MKESKLTAFLAVVIVVWLSGCGTPFSSHPEQPTLIAATPTRAATITPAPSVQPAAASLRDAIKNIHDQFKIDPGKGCFELLSPYSEYHKGLQKITALLLNDPRAQTLSFAERQKLFAQVTGFDGVRFIAGSLAATLVSLKTNRGYNAGCCSHYSSPDALYVVDQQNDIYEVGTDGLVKQTW